MFRSITRRVSWRARQAPCPSDSPWHGDGGMSTAEYAVGTIAAAAFAALLYTVVTGDSVLDALTALVRQAISVDF